MYNIYLCLIIPNFLQFSIECNDLPLLTKCNIYILSPSYPTCKVLPFLLIGNLYLYFFSNFEK